ncbi:MAG: PAS domain S-box protein, partial [Candidatus Cloacimonetes bacterium]|nr:PAS domain S-box protein [Candidatus Cloacimonadota bacterium]
MKKILVIDDTQDNLNVIKETLEDLIPDCRVLTALHGKKGLKIAKEKQPDTIITDIIMPEMDGYELCIQLKADDATKHIPIMILTGSRTDAESRVKCLDVGANVFLTKPIDSSELIAQVNVLLRIKEAEDKLREEREQLDETVKKRTKELRENEDNLLTLFNAMDEIVIEIDYDGRYVNIAPTSQNLLFKPSDEIIGKTLHEIFPKPEADIFLEFIRKSLSENKIKTIDYPLIIEDKELWFEGRAFPKTKNTVLFIARDITERKRAEESLKVRARILESMVEGFNVSDENGIIFFTNPAFEAMFGYEQGELIGKSVSVLNTYSPEENARFVGDVIEQLKTQGAWFGEVSNIKKDGTPFTTYCRVSTLEVSGKQCLISVQEDITERKQAEEALQESSEHWKTTFNAIKDSITILDKDNFIIQCNKSTCKLLGKSEEDIIGKK